MSTELEQDNTPYCCDIAILRFLRASLGGKGTLCAFAYSRIWLAMPGSQPFNTTAGSGASMQASTLSIQLTLEARACATLAKSI